MDLVFLTDLFKQLEIGRYRLAEHTFGGRHSHLEHHAHKPDFCAWHYVCKHASVLFAAAAQPVGDSTGKKYVTTRAQDRLRSVAEKGELSLEHIEGFVFGVVEVVRRREARSCREMNERIGAPGCLASGQDDMEGVEKPIGRRILERCGLRSCWMHIESPSCRERPTI